MDQAESSGATSWRNELRDQVLAVVDEVVRSVQVENRLSVEVDEGSPNPDGRPTIIHLRPANPRAMALGVQLDHDAEITYYVGRHGTIAEDFNRDRDELLASVRSFVQLAVSGNYREYVKQRGDAGHKAISRFIWPDSEEQGGFSYNVLLPRRWSSLGRKGWREETYEPY